MNSNIIYSMYWQEEPEKQYIGKTKNLKDRKARHLRDIRLRLHNWKVMKQYNKYKTLPIFSVLYFDIKDEHLSKMEIFVGFNYDSINLGLNVAEFGIGGNTFAGMNIDQYDHIREKISKNTKRAFERIEMKNNLIAAMNKQEVKDSLRDKALGRKDSEETKLKKKKSKSGRIYSEKELEVRVGKNNVMSVEKIMKRHSCSEEEAFMILSTKNKKSAETRKKNRLKSIEQENKTNI